MPAWKYLAESMLTTVVCVKHDTTNRTRVTRILLVDYRSAHTGVEMIRCTHCDILKYESDYYGKNKLCKTCWNAREKRNRKPNHGRNVPKGDAELAQRFNLMKRSEGDE